MPVTKLNSSLDTSVLLTRLDAVFFHLIIINYCHAWSASGVLQCTHLVPCLCRPIILQDCVKILGHIPTT